MSAPGRDRRRRACSRERELDALLVTDLVNVRWLTGFTGSNGRRSSGRDGTLRFVTDFRYLTQSAEELDRALGARDRAPTCSRGSPPGCPRATLRLGFDDATMCVKDHARLAGAGARRRSSSCRPAGWSRRCGPIKDAAELEAIRAAAAPRRRRR